MANPGPASATTIHPQSLGSNQAYRLLGYATGVSLAATGDAVTFNVINSATYNVTNVVITNASADVSGGALAIWTGPAGTGTEIVTNASLTSNTSSAYVTKSTVVAATGTKNLATQQFVVKVGTAVAASTVDIYIYGTDFSTF
ncbi:hypothetical protein UFOVP1109_37 [uncultured Caudovirales phage]|uniref:Uncharacterized protein n=1 Tax=uncultured Caudovirales phage TaxID=2100421 RepID=A0A6J5SMU7_9CAUD|nr:hypothetical protein UFOVP1109_37 [uncultured Caudovirales phage]CAB4215867.1 hypothetical protein UFOVP1473_20 [uncultured Caudovirales phage]CAB5230032.1 hypothetical protein UFOVP1560_28 [uncultured Caudovirales phage]